MAQPRIDEDVEITNVIFNTDLQSELGRGSDAAVYRGTWHGAPVAVKLLRDALVDLRDAGEGRTALLAQFLRESQQLRRLRHPNIVLFLGLCRSRGGLPALVTEIMNGTLRDRYQVLPPLTLLQELRLLRDVSAALSYLHSLEIIHRDLTTRNVLVSKDERAKVGDVGLSRSLHGDHPTDVLAMTQAPGTLLYMSPESLLEEAKYDQSLDIFSLGVLMMALIRRREPDGRLLVSPRIEVGPSGNVPRWRSPKFVGGRQTSKLSAMGTLCMPLLLAASRTAKSVGRAHWRYTRSLTTLFSKREVFSHNR